MEAPRTAEAEADAQMARASPGTARERIESTSKGDQFLPLAGYVAVLQRDGMTELSRERIVGWYEEMGAALGLRDHLLDLATNFLDRAVSARSVTADEFRQDAVAALYVASKLEGTAAFKATDVPVQTRGKITNIIAAEADLVRTLGWRTRAPTVAHAVHDAIAFHGVDDFEAAEALAFSRVARTSYELVGVPPSLIAAACVVAASSDARKVAEAASALDTPGGGSPSRVQGCAALLRAARAKQDAARLARVPVESATTTSGAHVVPDPPKRPEL